MKISVLLLFFVLLNVGCNPNTEQKDLSLNDIDSIYLQTNKTFRKNGEYEDLIKINSELIKKSEKIDYEKGAIRSYINIANLFWNLKKNKEAIDMLNYIKPNIKKAADPVIESWLYSEYMTNYYDLGLSQKGEINFKKSLEISDKIADKQQKKNQKKFLYTYIASKFQSEKKEDSALLYLKKAYLEGTDPLLESRIARSFLVLGSQTDSALFYLNHADSLYKTGNFPIYQKGILLRNKGLYFKTTKQYDSSVSAYEQSLDIFRSIKRPHDVRDNYKILYELYALKNDHNRADDYIRKYNSLRDSIEHLKTKAVDVSVSYMLDEIKHEERNKNLQFLIILSIIIIVVIIIGYRNYKQQKYRNESKAVLLAEKEETVQLLEQKVNESFNEIIQLARNNSPHFWSRFQEVYPDFAEKLISINPELKSSELAYCAYIYLGFNTKEIADYTFKSIGTIKNYRSYIRKSLGLTSEENFKTRLQTYINQKK